MTKRIAFDADGKLTVRDDTAELMEFLGATVVPAKPKRKYTRPAYAAKARAIVVTAKGREYLRQLKEEREAIDNA